MRRLVASVVILWAVLLTGCTSFIGMAPNPTKEDIAKWSVPLPAADSKTLGVHYKNHSNIYNAIVHTVGKDGTCPFLVYSPAYNKHESGAMTDAEWAAFLLNFFKNKHKQEGSCKCNEELGIPEPPPTVKNPCPVLVNGNVCGKGSTKYAADAEWKYMWCSATPPHEWKKPK